MSGLEPNIRMVTAAPSSASGGMIALNREPFGSRASTIGEVSSTRRPTRETIRSMIWSRCSLSRKTTSERWIRPSFSTKIFFGPLIMMSAIFSSLSSSSSGPKPKVSSRISLTSRCRSLRLSSGFSVSQRCSTTPRISLRSVFGSISLTRFMSSRSTRRMWMWRLSVSYASSAGSGSLDASRGRAAAGGDGVGGRRRGRARRGRGLVGRRRGRAGRAPGPGWCGVRTGSVQIL